MNFANFLSLIFLSAAHSFASQPFRCGGLQRPFASLTHTGQTPFIVTTNDTTNFRYKMANIYFSLPVAIVIIVKQFKSDISAVMINRFVRRAIVIAPTNAHCYLPSASIFSGISLRQRRATSKVFFLRLKLGKTFAAD